MNTQKIKDGLRALSWRVVPSDHPHLFEVVWMLRTRVTVAVYPDGAVVRCYNHTRRVANDTHPGPLIAEALDISNVSQAIRETVKAAGLMDISEPGTNLAVEDIT